MLLYRSQGPVRGVCKLALIWACDLIIGDNCLDLAPVTDRHLC